jgi:hypothetical protein
MKMLILISVVFLAICSCSSSSIKEKINKTGDVAGQVAGEFIDGASKGVQKAFDVQVECSEKLKEKGIEFGKTTVTSDNTGTDNMLLVYVIFNKDFKGTLTAKAFDENSLEKGRVSEIVNGVQNEAKYIEFHFGKHTNIDSKNKLRID